MKTIEIKPTEKEMENENIVNIYNELKKYQAIPIIFKLLGAYELIFFDTDQEAMTYTNRLTELLTEYMITENLMIATIV